MTEDARQSAMTDLGIRLATAHELSWIGSRPDPAVIERITRVEIDNALNATSRPPHWTPAEIDETLMR